MRVSTHWLHQQAVNAMLDQQQQLSRTQQQVATGKRILTPADDPAGASRGLSLDGVLAQTQQYQSNADLARTRLSLEENALSSAGDILQRVRELAVQANNASQTDETRASIAQEIRQRLDQLVGVANSKDGSDQYLFAGFNSNTQPFSKTASGVSYAGDQGQRRIQIGASRTVADGDPGSGVFMGVATGNGTFATAAAGGNTGTGVIGPGSVVDPTAWDGDSYTLSFTAPDTWQVTDSGGAVVAGGSYTDGQAIQFRGVQVSLQGAPAAGDSFSVAPGGKQSVFDTLDQLASVLEAGASSGADKAQVNNQVSSALSNLDRGIDNLLSVRSGVGARLNAIDGQVSDHEDFALSVKETLSNIRDLDYSQAISKLNQQMVGLQAAQQAYVKVNGLSLFNFLG